MRDAADNVNAKVERALELGDRARRPPVAVLRKRNSSASSCADWRLLLAGMLNRADDGWRLLLAERTTRNGVTCNALLASSSKDRSPPVERSPGDRVPGELVLSRTRCIKL
jgi:hypothetical protein